MKAVNKEEILSWGLYVVAILALTWPLWEYGFPLLYSDSGTYLMAANWGGVPIDRPFSYSQFLVLFSNWFGVHALPIVQAIMVLYMSKRFLNAYILQNAPRWIIPSIFILLSLLTGLPHLVCQLMPDLFTPFILLLIWELIHKQNSGLNRLSLWALLLFIIAIHTSHLLLGLFLFALVIVLSYVSNKRIVWIQFAYILPILLIIPTINKVKSGRFYYSDSSKVFFVASLQNAGVLEPWLARHCGEEVAPPFLCKNQSLLQGMDGNGILWGSEILTDESCIESGGWGYCWKLRNEELGPFMGTWWKDKEARNTWLKYAWTATKQQAVDFGIGMIASQKEGSAPYSVLDQFYTKDLVRYRNSAQFDHDLYFHAKSNVQWWTIVLSLFAFPLLILGALKIRAWKKAWNQLLSSLFLFLLANAAVCGVLSNPLDRYQARVIWLIPFFLLALMASVLHDVYVEKKKS